MQKIYGVVFKDGGKIYNFNAVDLDINIGDKVIVETEKGLQIAKTMSKVDDFSGDNIKQIIRIATPDDIEKYEKNLADAVKALNKAREIAQELGLEMNLIEASFTFDKKQLLLSYLAESRVDFRELAKRLAAIYHTRIELHQMGPRDKARDVGGVGICGRELCCIRILRHMDSVSMNMAKNQGIALNPSKINGSCGRLLCCFAYEDEEYSRCQQLLPSIGQTVDTDFGKGKVISVDILKKSFDVSIDGQIKKIEVSDDRKE